LSPRIINYQGFLADSLDQPITGTVSMSFGIYDAPTMGSELWSETQNVDVNVGVFDVLLGSVTPITEDVFTGGTDRWIELNVEGEPLAPRTMITSVGYAHVASYADTAGYALSAPTGSDGDWTISGSDMYSAVSGNVGIGTTSPWGRVSTKGGQVGFFADSSAATDFGFFGVVSNVNGIGIKTESRGDNGYGAFCEALGANSTGVLGHGKAYGVLGQASGTGGFGGYFTGDRHYFDNNVGVGTENPWGRVSTKGGQVGFFADSSAETDFGVYAVLSKANGIGIKTESRGSSGYGAFCEALGTNSTGVFGHGKAFGVFGQATGTNGYGGYFTGDRHYFDSNVGIGTTNPTSLLHIEGATAMITLNATATNYSGLLLKQGGSNKWTCAYDPGNDYLFFYEWASSRPGTRMVIKNGSGNVGIGIGNPTSRLHVGGDIHCTGKLNSDGGVDPPYVLYDNESRTAIVERIAREVPEEKLDGAVLFWNGEDGRLEIYLPLNGEFRDLDGNLLDIVEESSAIR
jgi:hypothetical protein